MSSTCHRYVACTLTARLQSLAEGPPSMRSQWLRGVSKSAKGLPIGDTGQGRREDGQ